MSATSQHVGNARAGGHSAAAQWRAKLEEVAAKSGTTVAEVSRTLSDVRMGEFSPDSVVTEAGSGWDFLEQHQVSAGVAGNDDASNVDDVNYVDLQELSWTLELPHVAEIVNDVVESMPEKQAQVLVLAYGLKGQPKLTLKEIAKQCGMKSHVLVKYH